MKYIFCVNPDGSAKRAGITPSGYDVVVAQNDFPAREYREGYAAVLKYSEELGVHWEYVKIVPSERRRSAYEHERCIEYAGLFMTVDEANRMWEEYQAEGSPRADELTDLIAAAKAAIRERYPDEEESEEESEPETEPEESGETEESNDDTEENEEDTVESLEPAEEDDTDNAGEDIE